MDREGFVHIKPEAHATDLEETHHLALRDENGRELAFADLVYQGEPFPHYYVEYMESNPRLRGAGYGKRMLEEINRMLLEKGKAGVLYDDIDELDDAAGMYERNGWTLIPDSDNMYVFNPPKGLAPEVLASMPARVFRKSRSERVKARMRAKRRKEAA